MRFAKIALLLVFLVATAVAAEGVSVTVRVVDGGDVAKAPIDGAYVSLGSDLSTETDESGEAWFESVPEGIYSMRVESSGYRTVSREVTISAETSEIRIELEED